MPSPDGDQWSYRDSLDVTAPADLRHPVLAACALVRSVPDWVRTENALHGDATWRPADMHAAPRLPLYLDRPSTTCGAPVGVHLAGIATTGVTVRAYRIGWYGGAGARLVWTSAPIDLRQGVAPTRSGDLMASPGWPRTVTLPVDSSWTPGEYVVESRDAGGVAGVASLVVRDAADVARLLVVHSSLTWAAYSQYSGSSLYKGPDGSSDTRALGVALDRPLVDAGLVRLLVDDVPLTQFLEHHGYAAAHIDDTDLDAWPSLALTTTALLLPGHSEYWTRRMYDAAVAARNAGVNIADLGANEVYWHARLERDPSGTPTSMFVGRTVAQDPLAAAQPDEATVLWHQAPLLRDPTALLGQRYSAVKAHGSLVVNSLPTWLGAGTGLRAGDVVTGVVANEADGIRPGSPSTPPNLQAVLVGVLTRAGQRDEPVSTTYYSAPSGSAVFAAGTTYWTCDLTDACPDSVVPAATATVVRTMTLNVLRAFSSPRFGRRSPSVRAIPASIVGLRASLPPAAIGTYGS